MSCEPEGVVGIAEAEEQDERTGEGGRASGAAGHRQGDRTGMWGPTRRRGRERAARTFERVTSGDRPQWMRDVNAHMQEVCWADFKWDDPGPAETPGVTVKTREEERVLEGGGRERTCHRQGTRADFSSDPLEVRRQWGQYIQSAQAGEMSAKNPAKASFGSKEETKTFPDRHKPQESLRWTCCRDAGDSGPALGAPGSRER